MRAAANEGVLPPAVRRLFHVPGVAVGPNEFIANRRDLDGLRPGRAVFALEPEPFDPVRDGPRGRHVLRVYPPWAGQLLGQDRGALHPSSGRRLRWRVHAETPLHPSRTQAGPKERDHGHRRERLPALRPGREAASVVLSAPGDFLDPFDEAARSDEAGAARHIRRPPDLSDVDSDGRERQCRCAHAGSSDRGPGRRTETPGSHNPAPTGDGTPSLPARLDGLGKITTHSDIWSLARSSASD